MSGQRLPIVALLLLLPLLLAGTAGADATRIELIELKGRTAEELIPLLQPVVKPEGALSGTGYRLIVRATPAQHREIRRLLEELDQAPRRLLISVHMGELGLDAQQSGSVHIERRVGDAAVGVGEPPAAAPRGLGISAQDTQGSASLQAYSSRSLADGSDAQQVQALEGEPAYIASGGDHPYPAQLQLWRGPRGAVGGAVDMQYREVRTGFYALARLRGDQVTVQISPQKESLVPHAHGAVQTQRIVTTVAGPLGSWIRLGMAGSDEVRRDASTGRVATTQTLRSQPMWLKVELLP